MTYYKREEMKKIFAGLCAACLLVACAPKVPDNEYLIEGRLEGVPDSTVIALYEFNSNLLQEVQRDTLTGGKFTFRDTISSLKKFAVMSDEPGFPNTWLTVWAAPGRRIEVSGSGKLFALWNVKSDLFEQQEETRFIDCAREVLEKQQAYSAAEKDLLMQMHREMQKENSAFPEEIWTQVDSIRRLSNPLQYEIARRQVECMKTAPFSTVWMNNLKTYAGILSAASKYDEFKDFVALAEPLKELYEALPDSVKQMPAGKSTYHSLYPSPTVKVGEKMYDSPAFDAEGRKRYLAEFAGKYILLDFWSQGCGPCVRSIPELEEIAADYADRLAVVSICSDSEELWKKFLVEKGMKGNQWNELRHDGEGLAAAYGVQGIPHYVLISPDGIVLDAWTGYGTGSLRRKIEGTVR